MGLLVRCCPSLGNQGLQFLLLFRGQFDMVLLSRHDPSLSRASTKHASGAEQKCTTREVIGQRKCLRQLFGRSVTEAGWQQAGQVSE